MNRYERMRELMERRGVDAVVLRRPANFAGYTGGADTKVDHVAPEGVADLIVRRDSQVVLTSTIEAPRMRAEQTLHHQGDLTGYASRELIATPATVHAIEAGQVFAWNPSITGAKAEETFVLTEAGPEVVAGVAHAVV